MLLNVKPYPSYDEMAKIRIDTLFITQTELNPHLPGVELSQ